MTMVLVTGATGTVGSEVVRELEDRSVAARAFVRDASKGAEKLGPRAEVAVGDFTDPVSMRSAMKDVDTVFLACSNQPNQVEHETAVIDAAVASGVKRIVKVSAVGAKIGSPLVFWDSHGKIEQHLQRSGVPAVVLRPSSYMSNLLASAEPIRNMGKLFAPARGARISMIDPRDVAAVAAVAITDAGHDGRTYTLTGPEAMTYERVAEDISAATGRQVDFVDVPDEGARQGMLAAGMPPWLADGVITLMGLLRQGAAAQTTDTVREVTGREPRTFAQFARDYAALFRA